jgi:hypothetical protein
MTDTITVATRNLHWGHTGLPKKLALLQDAEWELLMLQEVTPQAFQLFYDRQLGDSAVYPGSSVNNFGADNTALRLGPLCPPATGSRRPWALGQPALARARDLGKSRGGGRDIQRL